MHWETLAVPPEGDILTALQIIDRGAEQIALVVDERRCLLGTVTDGDIRRALLAGMTPGTNIQLAMNAHPIVALENEPHIAILSRMQHKGVRQIPVVDAHGRIVAVRFLHDFQNVDNSKHWVVLMAGGLGTRLRPLTDNVPKPLLKVGDKPILERIITSFAEHGFQKFFVTVHYKADMVKQYFGNGERFGVDISYLEEPVQLGTAGALGLLPETPPDTFFVMNADLVTAVNFRQLLNFHKEQQAEATMCVFKYNFQVPYGVVGLQDTFITQINEKPTHSFFVNAGIYTLEPAALDRIKPAVALDMPTLFTDLIGERKCTAAFPIREEWADIGRVEDYLNVRESFVKASSEPSLKTDYTHA